VKALDHVWQDSSRNAFPEDVVEQNRDHGWVE
jgi:hypothetical protein